jgi:hypothetical protein
MTQISFVFGGTVLFRKHLISYKGITAMHQAMSYRQRPITLWKLVGAIILSSVSATVAADLAASNAPGTLTVRITAVGDARHKAPPRAGLDARRWQINNTGQFTIRLRASGPMGSVAPAAAAKDHEIMDKWERKMDACKGNESCEMQVQGQMISDPEYHAVMQRMGGAVQAEAASAAAARQGQQVWMANPTDPSPASGSLAFNVVETSYGVVDAGGKGDTTCRWTGKLNIAPNSPESKVGATVLINASTYEVRIPAEAFGMKLTESCSSTKGGAHGPSKNQKYIPLIGRSPPRGVKHFDQLLTFRGPAGSSRSPQLSGKQTVTTEWLDANNANPIPVKVTIDWHFTARAR